MIQRNSGDFIGACAPWAAGSVSHNPSSAEPMPPSCRYRGWQLVDPGGRWLLAVKGNVRVRVIRKGGQPSAEFRAFRKKVDEMEGGQDGA